jgi:addiction module RelE/StbE family toxin
MNADFSKYFKKRFKKLSVSVRTTFQERLDLFLSEPFHPLLHNHPLYGKYSQYRSINITGDIRAVFKQYEDLARFEGIGTHSELYK